MVFFGDSSASVLTVSSNVALFSSVSIVGGKIGLRRPPCIRVLTTRARAAAPRRPRARRTFFRATPGPETGAASSVSSTSRVETGADFSVSSTSRVDTDSSVDTSTAVK